LAKEWRWGLRVATDARFGGGHVARSAALAAALGGRVHLFVDPAARPSDALDPFSCTAEASCAGFASLLAALPELDGVVIDSPAIADADVAAIAARAWTAAFRDGAPNGSEQLAIDLSPGAKDGAWRLGGPAWAPLAPLFAVAHEHALRDQRAAGAPLRVLVAFGARDSTNRTGLVVDALRQLGRSFVATVVLGAAFDSRDGVDSIAARHGDFRVVTSPTDMSTLYLAHDLAIGAPGVSQYERACCGLPTILIAQNQRQEPLAEAWAAKGCALLAAPTTEAIVAGVETLLADDSKRRALHDAALTTVDGAGAERLAAALEARLGEAPRS
jgi:spore coat polysaccharide biosynthesis predicted glycosyltransferase SpsG